MRSLTAPLSVVVLLLVAGGCTSQREAAVGRLAETGAVVARWDLRDEFQKSTFTRVAVRNGDTITVWEILGKDGYRSVNLEQAGTIERTGCFSYERGFRNVGPVYLSEDGRRLQRDSARTSTAEKTPTDCSEYRDTPAWPLVPRTSSL